MPLVIKVFKSTGIQPTHLRSDDLEKRLYNYYVDYFRGKHHATFSKNEQVRHLLELDSVAVRNELDPQPVNLPIDQIRVF
jgi:hypothetical protein